MGTQNVSLMPQRIESLDALRGLDLFFLVAFGPFARTLLKLRICRASMAFTNNYPMSNGRVLPCGT